MGDTTTAVTLEKINILLIGEDLTGLSEAESSLRQRSGFVKKIWHCAEMGNARLVLADILHDLDVIVADQRMFEFEGLDIDVLVQLAKTVPIVVYNCGSELGETVQLMAAGASDCVTTIQAKTDPDRLRTVIIKAILRAECQSGRSDGVATDQHADRLRLAGIVRHMRTENQKVLHGSRQLNAALREEIYELKVSQALTDRKAADNLDDREQLIFWLTGGYSVRN
jgi:FixJ family two-component response regulator